MLKSMLFLRGECQAALEVRTPRAVPFRNHEKRISPRDWNQDIVA